MASADLQKLCDIGGTEHADGRDKLFVNMKLIELMRE